MQNKIFEIEQEPEQRLDVFLLNHLDNTSRSQIKNAIEDGRVLVNEKKVKSGYLLKEGDRVVFQSEEKKALSADPEEISLDIVFEDDILAVINKPQGMVVHPAVGNTHGTLVNALTFHFNKLSTINGSIRPGIVHRLDKDTSGLLVIAKTDEAHRKLAKQIEEKIAVRKYYAILEGVIKEDQGTIDKNLKRSDKDRKKYTTCENNQGKRAVSHFEVLQRFEKNTLCEFRLETGRTHQIRVHAQFLKHPVVGDMTYGFRDQKIVTNGQLLHSHYLGFYHPTTDEWIEFETGIPKSFKEILKKLT